MIRFDCINCGKKLTVPDDRAGKLGKCPGCKETFRIPGADADDEIPEELETVAEAPRPANRPAAEDDREDALRRQEDSDARLRSLVKKPKKRKRRQSGNGVLDFITNIDPIFMIFGIGGFLCVTTLCAGLVMPHSALVPALLGLMTGLVCQLWLLVKAFQDDLLHGLGCLFIPFYVLYFAITRFDEAKYPFCLGIMGYAVAGIGLAMSGETDIISPRRNPAPTPVFQRRALAPHLPQDSWAL